jgi:hypothetical protein
MLFSTNSAMAFKGLDCDSAMIRMAFQSSPIRNLPVSLFFAFMLRRQNQTVTQGDAYITLCSFAPDLASQPVSAKVIKLNDSENGLLAAALRIWL